MLPQSQAARLKAAYTGKMRGIADMYSTGRSVPSSVRSVKPKPRSAGNIGPVRSGLVNGGRAVRLRYAPIDRSAPVLVLSNLWCGIYSRQAGRACRAGACTCRDHDLAGGIVETVQRRNAIKLIVVGLNAVLAAALLIPGVRFLADPLHRRRGKATFIRVAPYSAIPDEQPVRVPVVAIRQDAFTRHPPGPIGSVWLRRVENGDQPRVLALQVICPHLGCGVDYAATRGRFACPCHASDFMLDGSRVGGPAPRGMDELPSRISEPDENGERWVEVAYREFHTGLADKKAKA